MRKFLLSLTLAAAASASLGAAIPGSAHAAPAALAVAPGVYAAPLQTVQYYENWRYREWRRHEAYERWRRHAEWRRWHQDRRW